MLELIFLLYLSRKIGEIAAKKGHRKGPNIRFFLLMWFGGEIIGFLLGLLIFKGKMIPVYIFALIGAALGTVIAFNVVEKLENISEDGTITIDID